MSEKEKYIALTGLNSDATGKRYERGEVITDKDFPKKIIKHWLAHDRPVLADYSDELFEELSNG